MSEQVTLSHDTTARRYEIHLEGQRVGLADYVIAGDVITFTHTEVDPAFRGRGLASQLVAYSLDDVAGRGLRVVPLCSMYAAYLRRHPEAATLAG